MPKTETSTTIYHAAFELDPAGQWLAQIIELPAVHTFGRTLGKAREYLADALALWLDVPVESLNGRIEFAAPALPDVVRESVEKALTEREIADSVNRVASQQVTEAAVRLVEDAHLSLRDAADILGISHQRVQQLVASGRPERRNQAVASVPDELLDAFRDYLPGGAKEDIGALAAAALIGLAVIWIEGRRA
jgi:predicted RNase H-like HicB family nuclease